MNNHIINLIWRYTHLRDPKDFPFYYRMKEEILWPIEDITSSIIDTIDEM